MLSTSKMDEKKLCHTVTFVFCIFYVKKRCSDKFFFTIGKLIKNSTKFILPAFYFGSDFRRKSRLKDEHFKFRVLLCNTVTLGQAEISISPMNFVILSIFVHIGRKRRMPLFSFFYQQFSWLSE
jgi:hypothetical protein